MCNEMISNLFCDSIDLNNDFYSIITHVFNFVFCIDHFESIVLDLLFEIFFFTSRECIQCFL